MTKHPIQSTSALWARFRFSVVGSLLSAPPARGELKSALESLAAKTWTHPVTGRDVHFAAKTIETLVLPRPPGAGRSGGRLATGRAERLRQGVPEA